LSAPNGRSTREPTSRPTRSTGRGTTGGPPRTRRPGRRSNWGGRWRGGRGGGGGGGARKRRPAPNPPPRPPASPGALPAPHPPPPRADLGGRLRRCPDWPAAARAIAAADPAALEVALVGLLNVRPRALGELWHWFDIESLFTWAEDAANAGPVPDALAKLMRA